MSSSPSCFGFSYIPPLYRFLSSEPDPGYHTPPKLHWDKSQDQDTNTNRRFRWILYIHFHYRPFTWMLGSSGAFLEDSDCLWLRGTKRLTLCLLFQMSRGVHNPFICESTSASTGFPFLISFRLTLRSWLWYLLPSKDGALLPPDITSSFCLAYFQLTHTAIYGPWRPTTIDQ